MPEHRIWVSDDRMVLVTLWVKRAIVTVATRSHPDAVWGPPITCKEEKA